LQTFQVRLVDRFDWPIGSTCRSARIALLGGGVKQSIAEIIELFGFVLPKNGRRLTK
jgi:hypothetical protein